MAKAAEIGAATHQELAVGKQQLFLALAILDAGGEHPPQQEQAPQPPNSRGWVSYLGNEDGRGTEPDATTGASSVFPLQAYVDTLPRHIDLPCTWGDEQTDDPDGDGEALKWLDGSPLFGRCLAEQRRTWENEYALLSKLVPRFGQRFRYEEYVGSETMTKFHVSIAPSPARFTHTLSSHPCTLHLRGQVPLGALMRDEP